MISYKIWKFTIPDLMVVFLFLYFFIRYKKIYISKKSTNFYLIIFSFVIIFSFLFNINNEYLSYKEFVFSFIKLSFYLSSVVIIPGYISKNISKLNHIIKYSIYFICFFGIYQAVIFYSGIDAPSVIKIPFLELSGPETSISYGILRIKSIFSEPAVFGSFLNILYGYLLHYKYKINKFLHFLVVISVLMTLSLVAIGLLIINYIFYFLINKNIKINKKVIGVIFLIFFILLLMNNSFISMRLNSIINRGELSRNSSTIRLLGGWEYALNVPWFGIGLGNGSNYFKKNIDDYKFIADNGTVHNIFSVIWISSGILGLIIFLIYLFSITKTNRGFRWFIFAYCFGTGAFISFQFWFILILVESQNFLIRYKKRNYL